VTDGERRARVAEIAAREQCDTTKAGVLDVLARGGSFDVQACPGAGKTTVVATKVVVLLDGWRGRAGILVLTHTNVAREEIQKRLRRSDVGRAALDAPHFVGTIQSFVDTFLALPYMRAKGMPVEQIDNDAFASAADDEYARGYHKLRFWLNTARKPGQPEDRRYRALEYGAAEGELTFDGKETRLKNPETESYKELARLKAALTARGVFRHADMYHFASRYLDEFPWAAEALRARFRVVLLDEMQDTSARQEALLNRLFPSDAVDVQRFGDENQKIYDLDASADEPTTFPRDPVVNLGESVRFGEFIAARIATIAPRKQTILGASVAPPGRHTILLFDERTAHDVVPRFAQIAADELRDLAEPPVVKAIGNRKRPSDGGKFPNHVGEYVEGFVPDAVAAISGPEGMRLRVERAKAEMARDPSAGPAQIMIGVRMLIARWASDERPHRVVSRIMQDAPRRRRLGAAVLALLAADDPDHAAWDALVRPILGLLQEVVGVAAPTGATAFAKWVPIEKRSAVTGGTPPASLPVHVDVQTIHSVKGENHHATLVLETQYKKHDVPMVLRYLTDAAVRKKALGADATMHHRRMFVAMSRPRRLLCMAAAAAHVDEATRAELAAQGWIVEDLCAGGGTTEPTVLGAQGGPPLSP
jgi:DNA helicase II / ATP-dependent DNA helicase PcrA